jgi:diguanylate cyclase (GGDEF)-like protein
LSASFGVAEWTGPSEEPSRLLMRADQALYQAKRAGRNRVQVTGADIDMEPIDPIAA